MYSPVSNYHLSPPLIFQSTTVSYTSCRLENILLGRKYNHSEHVRRAGTSIPAKEGILGESAYEFIDTHEESRDDNATELF